MEKEQVDLKNNHLGIFRIIKYSSKIKNSIEKINVIWIPEEGGLASWKTVLKNSCKTQQFFLSMKNT